MEVEGSPHQVSLEARREDNAISTTPTRTPSQKWTAAESEWFGNLWSYDENFCHGVEGGSHHDVLDGGSGNGDAFTMPTRALPRKWTSREKKWYAKLWSYDGNMREKVCSGEYVLERPPKKPGGTVRNLPFYSVFSWRQLVSLKAGEREMTGCLC